MDNLIAEDLTDEAIVVTMNNSYFNETILWDWDLITDNLMHYIIPFIEKTIMYLKMQKIEQYVGYQMVRDLLQIYYILMQIILVILECFQGHLRMSI